jgi:predicted DNA-binding transcriptional regulator AlpA
MSTEVTTEFKLLSFCQLAEQLGVHRSTIYRKLRKKGIKPPGELLGPKWVEIIIQVLNDDSIKDITQSNIQ